MAAAVISAVPVSGAVVAVSSTISSAAVSKSVSVAMLFSASAGP